MGLDQAERQPANRHGERLGPGVATHAGDDRHPDRQSDGSLDRPLEEVDHSARQEGREEIDVQPGQPAPHRDAPSGRQLLVGRDAAELEQVFGGLRFDHINQIVEGDPAEQSAAVIDHGDAR